MTREIFIVGNWKMNQNVLDIDNFFEAMSSVKGQYDCHAWIAPQAVHICKVLGQGKELGVLVGSQNCSNKESGALTGELSPVALKDMGVHFTLVGHSERRAIFKEDDALLNEKTLLALKSGLKVIFCVGETLEEREADETSQVIGGQLKNGLKNIPQDQLSNIIVAYEPVWAIGTGKTASPEQAEEVHAFIRKEVLGGLGFNADSVSILYGGSVKPSNVKDLMGKENIDGALVGGASLKGEDFSKLCLR